MIPEARSQEIESIAKGWNDNLHDLDPEPGSLDSEVLTAAAGITELVAEVRRLREALEQIAERCESWDEPVNDLWVARLGERARAALIEESEEK